jgi:hypothetical protein
MEIQYSQLKINHLNNTPSTKAAGGGIFSGVFHQGRQGTIQSQEDFELSWYLFFQQLQQEQPFLTWQLWLHGVMVTFHRSMPSIDLLIFMLKTR